MIQLLTKSACNLFKQTLSFLLNQSIAVIGNQAKIFAQQIQLQDYSSICNLLSVFLAPLLFIDLFYFCALAFYDLRYLCSLPSTIPSILNQV